MSRFQTLALGLFLLAAPLYAKQGKGDADDEEYKSGKKAVKYQIENLSDPDKAVRENAADMLGYMTDAPNIMEAVPYLIEALNDKHIMVQLKAHGSLNRITGKNFGHDNYPAWKSWWEKNKDELEKNPVIGPTDIAKESAEVQNTYGLVALGAHDHTAAVRHFLAAVNADPEVVDYRNNLGLALLEQGRYIDAIKQFMKTIAMNAEVPQPYMNIGMAFARMNKHIEAQAWFRDALARDKNGVLWETSWSLGKEFLQKGDFHMALEFLKQAYLKARNQNVQEVRIHRDLALAYYALDMHHSAWREIMNVRTLGRDLHPDFVEKVRQALEAQGIDPEKEDEKAREHQRKMAANEGGL